MRPRFIRQALAEYVTRRTRTPDVWPAVRRQVTPRLPVKDGIHVQPTAARGGLLMPVAALLLLAVVAVALAPWLGGLLPQPHAAPGALPAAAITPTPAPARDANSNATTPNKPTGADYGAVLNRNLAARLGIDEARLNAAFAAALSDTADQAVQAGDLDASEATKIKGTAQAGLGSIVSPFGAAMKAQRDPNANAVDERAATLLKAALTAAPQALGISADAYIAAQTAGQSIAAIAQAHNVTLEKLKTAMLAAARTAADAQVHSGAWTQAEADAAYQAIGPMLDKMLASDSGQAASAGSEARVTALTDAAFAAGAQALGLTPAALQDALQQGQRLATLAQAHNVSADTLKTTMLAAARTAADAQVHSGAWTQPEADDAYKGFIQMISDKLFPGGTP